MPCSSRNWLSCVSAPCSACPAPLARFGGLRREELGGVARRLLLLVEVLGDEGLGQGVRPLRGELRIPALKGDLDEARVANRLDLEPLQEGAGQLTRATAHPTEVGMSLEVQ